MKVLILAGGRGKRIGKETSQKNKCMIPINGRPLIEYTLEGASGLNISGIVAVIGYMADDIVGQYGKEYKGKSIEYVVQEEQGGLVHAIECASHAIGKEDFMLMLGDELLINPRHDDMIKFFKEEDLFGVCGVVLVDDKMLIRKTYSVKLSSDSTISFLEEKPEHPMDNVMGTGNCIFKNEILSYIERTPINPNRGERELPDLIQVAINDDNKVKPFRICDHYVNINVAEELKRAESYFTHL